jgi:hypothetical protein
MESDIENEFDFPSADDISLEQAERVEYNNNKDIDKGTSRNNFRY